MTTELLSLQRAGRTFRRRVTHRHRPLDAVALAVRKHTNLPLWEIRIDPRHAVHFSHLGALHVGDLLLIAPVLGGQETFARSGLGLRSNHHVQSDQDQRSRLETLRMLGSKAGCIKRAWRIIKLGSAASSGLTFPTLLLKAVASKSGATRQELTSNCCRRIVFVSSPLRLTFTMPSSLSLSAYPCTVSVTTVETVWFHTATAGPR